MKLLKLVPDNTNIKFLRWSNAFYVMSAFLIAASIFLVFSKGLNLRIDFVDGQMIRVTFTQSAEAPVAELRTQVAELGYGGAMERLERGHSRDGGPDRPAAQARRDLLGPCLMQMLRSTPGRG